MNLAVSNIAWKEGMDAEAYAIMESMGFRGLEIAPTRILPENPYGRLDEARAWRQGIGSAHGFCIPSMQSIWHGRTESIFGTDAEREQLLSYTKEAVGFAEAIGCRNLVFGCPRNRIRPDGADEGIAIRFFREAGDYAAAHGTAIGMEANPPIYNTNYVNDTASAAELIREVGSEGFRLNLDLGTMVHNGEGMDEIRGYAGFISHVHISEPYLGPIVHRGLHKELREMLGECGYGGFVSIEMGCRDDIAALKESMEYVREVFYDG